MLSSMYRNSQTYSNTSLGVLPHTNLLYALFLFLDIQSPFINARYDFEAHRLKHRGEKEIRKK